MKDKKQNSKATSIVKRMNEINPMAMFPDGLEKAIVGIVTRPGLPQLFLLSSKKCISLLKGQGMSAAEASEFFEYNILTAYMGENTPVYLDDLND